MAVRSYAVATVAAAGAICDDTACQVYLGLPDQYGPTADDAVAATAGQVLYCDAGTACGPAGSVAAAEYSASTGGYTAGGAFPAVADLGDSVAANPVHSWTVSIPVSRVESVFPSVGALEAIEVTQRNGLGQIGGRVEQMTVVGAAGSVSLTGDQFAADFRYPVTGSSWRRLPALDHSAPPGTAPTAPRPPAPTGAACPRALAPTTATGWSMLRATSPPSERPPFTGGGGD